MNDNQYIYQAMFLLDNGEVREQGFNAVRDWVKTTLEKHGAEVKVLRLWGERPLAYPVQGRARATYLLGWIQGTEKTVSAVKHEMYLLGPVFRNLFLKEEEIPAEELALGIEAIKDEDVTVLDDTPVAEQLFEDEEEAAEEKAEEKSEESGDEAAEGEEASKSEEETKEGETAAAATSTEKEEA